MFDRLKQNIITCLTFLFSVVLANIISDTPLDNILTKDITFIFEIVLLASLPFMIFNVMEMNYKLKRLKSAYNKIKESYKDVLDPNDISIIFNNDEILDDSIKDVKKKRNIIIIIWLLFLISCLIAIEIFSSHKLILPIINNLFHFFYKILSVKQ